MDTADWNYMATLIDRARRETEIARHVAGSFELTEVAERLAWAIDFLAAADEKMPANGRNPDGTTGPEHVTSEGVELRPDDVCQCGLARSEHTGSLGGTFLERTSR